jgi:hypothetical protein
MFTVVPGVTRGMKRWLPRNGLMLLRRMPIGNRGGMVLEAHFRREGPGKIPLSPNP